MIGYALSEEQSRRLQDAIEDLTVQADAQAAFLTDYGGNVMAYESGSDDVSIQTIAALAAGSFCATRELAGMIGEPTFHSVFHRGDKASIYIQTIAATFLILVIFGNEATPGLVKLYVDKLSKEIDPLIQDLTSQDVASAGGSGQIFELNTEAGVFGS